MYSKVCAQKIFLVIGIGDQKSLEAAERVAPPTVLELRGWLGLQSRAGPVSPPAPLCGQMLSLICSGGPGSEVGAMSGRASPDLSEWLPVQTDGESHS